VQWNRGGSPGGLPICAGRQAQSETGEKRVLPGCGALQAALSTESQIWVHRGSRWGESAGPAAGLSSHCAAVGWTGGPAAEVPCGCCAPRQGPRRGSGGRGCVAAAAARLRRCNHPGQGHSVRYALGRHTLGRYMGIYSGQAHPGQALQQQRQGQEESQGHRKGKERPMGTGAWERWPQQTDRGQRWWRGAEGGWEKAGLWAPQRASRCPAGDPGRAPWGLTRAPGGGVPCSCFHFCQGGIPSTAPGACSKSRAHLCLNTSTVDSAVGVPTATGGKAPPGWW